jgi:microcystin-dependent protein
MSFGVPTGGIIMWSGAVADIPSGWSICDGTNGTPDLHDRFIVAAGTGYAVGATGGASSVTLTAAQSGLPVHSHGVHSNYVGYFENVGSTDWGFANGGGRSFKVTSDSLYSDNTGGSSAAESHENRPAYYALAFIMKL